MCAHVHVCVSSEQQRSTLRIVWAFTAAQAVRKTVANLPAVRKWYDDQVAMAYMQATIQGKKVAFFYRPFYAARDL